MERYRAQTGVPLTYQELADRTGIARSTIESLATRTEYNTSLKTVAKLCEALECGPADLLELKARRPSSRRKGKRE